jgi:cobalt-zinc-cadmium efflux system membrane fusion protein
MKAKGVGIDSDLVAAQAHLDEAHAELVRTRSSAAFLGKDSNGSVEVRAPIEGDVLDLHASLGAAARSDGDPLVELGDANDLMMVTDVFERELSMLKAGDTATAELASAEQPVKLRVISVGAAVDLQTRRAPVYLSFEGAHVGARAGMYARVTVQASANGTVGVPTSAVLVKDGGKTVVYVAVSDTHFVARDVNIGHPVDGLVPVLAGLRVGERIAVRGALLLDATAEQLL